MTKSFSLLNDAGARWWSKYRTARDNFLQARRQDDSAGSAQASLKNNRCIYATGGHRPPRLYSQQGGDPYFTNYQQYFANRRQRDEEAEERFESSFEVMADPTTQDSLIGQDPVYALLVGNNTSVEVPRNSPDSLIINDLTIETTTTNDNPDLRLNAEQQKQLALSLDNQDKYNPATAIVETFAFNINQPETTRFGQISTKNKFEQRIRIFNPKNPQTNFVPIVDAPEQEINSLAREDLMNPNARATYRQLATNREWSKVITPVIRHYT